MIAWIGSNVANFFAQIALAAILTSFGKKKAKTPESSPQDSQIKHNELDDVERISSYDKGRNASALSESSSM